jgi:transcriptional regulator with XRE-family HTH domain
MNPSNTNPDTNDPDITLKVLIEQAGTNQRQLSKDSGVAEVTINSWVAGKHSPKLDSAVLVAAQLGVSLKTLAKSLQINVAAVPGDYSLLELKALARELGIETIDELPEDYRMLTRRRQLGDRQN